MVGDGEEPELCLRLGIGEVRPISGDADSAKVCRDERCFERKEKCQEKQKLQQQQQNKKITIFYKGRICACDVTEIQLGNMYINGEVAFDLCLEYADNDMESNMRTKSKNINQSPLITLPTPNKLSQNKYVPTSKSFPY